MDKELFELLVQVDAELASYLKTHNIDVANIAPRRVALICNKCNRTFKHVEGGLRCPCGQYIKIKGLDDLSDAA